MMPRKTVYIRNPHQAKFYTESGVQPVKVVLEDGIWKWVYIKEEVADLFKKWCDNVRNR